MKQEDKQLLLQNLCAMLSYDVCVHIRYKTGEPCYGKLTPRDIQWFIDSKIEIIKPYLRPMSSMTEEEIYEYNKLVELDRSDKESFNNLRIDYIQNHPEYKNMPFVPMYRHIDYLNTHCFDYRGLIEIGLALPAKEGMYKV